MFSLTGGLFAIIIMMIAQKSKLFSIYGVSVLGAAFHHIGQIIISMFLMGFVTMIFSNNQTISVRRHRSQKMF